MWRFDIDKSEYTRYIQSDNRWYMPISEIIKRKYNDDKQNEETLLVEEVQKNDLYIKWNTHWENRNDIKNVQKIYIIHGNDTNSSINFMESEFTLVGVLASVSYCEYYCGDVLKDTTKSHEHNTCIYAFSGDITTIVIAINEKSFYPQKAYFLCDLLFKELNTSVKIVVINIDKPKYSALSFSHKVNIPKTNFSTYYIKSKKCTNILVDQFAPLPINHLVTGFPAAVLTYCEIYDMDCILFQYVFDMKDGDLSVRSDYFYGLLSLLNQTFKSQIDKYIHSRSNLSNSTVFKELGDPKNQMFL